MKIRKSSFSPYSDFKDKNNYKPFILIEEDGTAFERIFLDIPDPEHRENIICTHYLKEKVRIYEKKI